MLIPNFVIKIVKKIENAGFEAYLVGGCVRDLLMHKTPKDWDLATNALPDDVLEIFDDAVYENEFGTVLVKIKNDKNETETVLEVTTYRSEHSYSDHRRPDQVVFESSLDKDLERRDFTVNAMALKIDLPKDFDFDNKKSFFDYQDYFKENNDDLIDLFGGQKDIQKKIIRAVGEPSDRFREDALRMMRAIRFACQLGFELEAKTQRAITKMAGSIKFVANERIKDEFVKILSSDQAYEGVMLMQETKILQYIIPEMMQGVGMKQNHHHTYSVFKHLVLSLKNCPSQDWQVRLASMLHDIGKPKSKKIIKGAATFYNHEYIGEKLVQKIMKRLKFSSKEVARVSNLVRNHMFYYNVDEVTEASVRRLIRKVGKENLKDLIDVRIADRLGSGTPKGKPYKLRHLEYLMKKVQNDPISVKMLKINGQDIMQLLNIKPSVKIGTILDILLAEVIENPKLNNKDYLSQRSLELNNYDIDELRIKAKQKIDLKKEQNEKKMKKEFFVK